LPPFDRTGKKKLLSVTISAFEASQWIGEAIQSVLAQSLPEGWELEIIVSVDGCHQTLVAALAIQDPRITVLELSNNGGTYRARNTAIAFSAGELIAVLDSDDLALPQRFITQIKMLQSDHSIGLLGGQLEYSDSSTRPESQIMRFHEQPSDIFWSGGDFLSYMICHGTWMFRREILRQLGGYSDYRVGADVDFCLRTIASNIKCISLSNKLTQYPIQGPIK